MGVPRIAARFDVSLASVHRIWRALDPNEEPKPFMWTATVESILATGHTRQGGSPARG